MSLKRVVGQDRAKQTLTLLTHGYKRRGFMPPIGVFGGSGLGKTNLLQAWTDEIGAKIIYMNGTAVKDSLAFRSYFKEAAQNPTEYYILFVDECHCLPKKVQDNLLSVLEQPAILCTVAPKEMGVVHCVDGQRFIDKGDVMREKLPSNMSFVLATTDPAKLKEPVLNRLRRIHLTPYTAEEKQEITRRHLREHNVTTNDTIVAALANRCRSIRHLKQELCETFLDIKTLYDDNNEDALGVLDEMLGIDEDGATDMDIDYMEYLAENPTVGLDTMAGRLGVDKQEVFKHVEPFLLSKGWVMITGRGRRLTKDGRKKITRDIAAPPPFSD